MEEPVVASGGGGTHGDSDVVVAGQHMTVQEWLAQQGATARVNIDRDLVAGLGPEFWGQEGELSPLAAAAGLPPTSEEKWSGDEESVVTVRGSAGPLQARTRHFAHSPAGLQDTPRPGVSGVAGEKAPQRRSKVGFPLYY